ncbi:MAG TPA: rhodanese-related sulfurtransferase [Patescibacteria group bacterium]|nr:rhodanese-related sulfurtransferase [Patescibacteria group bacterium]
MQKIILYYKFVPIADPEAVRLWQKALCEKLDLKGRIIISSHGINGTLGGDIAGLKSYAKENKSFTAFKGVQFKWSDGSRDDFPKLSVKVRDEIVTFGARGEVKVDENGIVGGGKHLRPEELHQLVKERGEDVVFFDGRNKHEAAIGKFKKAVVPAVEHTRDFLKELEDPKYNDIKDKPVVAYCTGGIRCEVLSVLMKNRGFKEVYQLDGGIVKYGEAYGDDGLWEGSLYVFDDRVATKFSHKAKDIGTCVHCNEASSNYENCANKACNKLILVCKNCHSQQLCPDCVAASTAAIAKL